MTRYKRKSFILFMAVINILLCLIIPIISFNAAENTVYAESISYPEPSGDNPLSAGSKGDEVKWLQEALNIAADAGLTVDGDFGPGTESAVKKFQEEHGLEQTGKVDTNTISEIKNCLTDVETQNDSADDNSEDEQSRKLYTRHIPEKEEGHLFRSYWKNYFVTLKDTLFHFGSTIGPVITSAGNWLAKIIIAAIAIILFSALFPTVYISPISGGRYIVDDGGASDGIGCLMHLVFMLVFLSPIISDVKYVMLFSETTLGKAIGTGIVFTLLKTLMGALVSAPFLILAKVTLGKLSDELASKAIDYLSGAIVLLFNSISVVMVAWITYGV